MRIVGVVVRRNFIGLRTAMGELTLAFMVAMILETITHAPILIVGVVKDYDTHAVVDF